MKTKRVIILVAILISVSLVALGLIYYNNQPYTRRLIRNIYKSDIIAVEELLKSPTGNVNSKEFLFDIEARIAETGNRTPLQFACLKGNFEIVKMLVDAGADVNAVEPIGKGTPLWYALDATINEHRLEIANYLIDNGAYDQDELLYVFGSTCLNDDGTKNTVKEKTEYDLFLKMIDKGANPRVTDRCGSSVLHKSSSDDNLLATKYLIDIVGIDPNLSDNDGRTPLFYCDQIDTAEFLLLHGADKSIKDIEGKTAYDYAIAEEKHELAKLLEAD